MTRFSAVHQYHSGAAAGDAITQQMFALQGTLREMGYTSEVFAAHIDETLKDRVRPIGQYPGSRRELLLFHHSMGSDVFDEVLELPNTVVTVYHNITPVDFFDDSGWRAYAQLGQEQLRLLAARCRLGIADSNYNRREMLAAGFAGVDVLPVRTSYQGFRGDSSTASNFFDWLFVGRLVANKRQLELVRAFAVYVAAYDPDARLLLVGDLGQRDYVEQVRAEIRELGLVNNVVLAGKVNDRELRAAYGSAGVFVSLSAHEGFGIPLVEAMASGVPVVAFAAAAIPETLGGAGVLLREADWRVVAATVRAINADPEFRSRLVERQFERVRQLESFDTAALLRNVIQRATEAGRRPEIQVQGPFETSYSLAVLNRRLAESLAATGRYGVSIYATEGPGDYEPSPDAIAQHPVARALYERSALVPYPDVVIRQMYPPRVIDSPGGVTLEYFGWEESRLAPEVVADFNRYVTCIGAMSMFARQVLRDSGVTVPITVVGVGVDPPDVEARISALELDGLPGFRFLHISSGFPRKGIDVLLHAYFASFSGSDDVTLVLKTFPNPHNETGELLAKLRSSTINPPKVHWIDRDLSPEELHGLYNLASCYVHPARGEGFGLPVAEAMAAGVPVISLSYSGLADFVSPDTAALVRYEVEPARTHLSVEGSVWAEPDPLSLADEMTRIFHTPDAPEVLARQRTAQALIRGKYSWAAVGERWEQSIALAVASVQRPRVAMVSTWNSRCGIAENTRYIVDGLGDDAEIDIYADHRPEVVDVTAEARVTRCWVGVWEPDLTHLESELNAWAGDVVHVQFNFGFFALSELARLVEAQQQQRAVVVSLHRTQDIDVGGQIASLRSIAPTLRALDRVIVHQEADRQHLAGLGVAENVTVVPLGAPPPPPISPAAARDRLGLGDVPLLGTFGFLLPHKGLLDLLRLVEHLRTEIVGAHLIAACALHPDPSSKAYEEVVRAFIAERGLEGNVTLITDFLPDEAAQVLLRAVDAIVLPYHATEESSSAALRFVLPLERPIIATNLGIFDDAGDALIRFEEGDEQGLVSAVRRVLLDDTLSERLAAAAGAAAQRYRWDMIAAEHRQVYATAITRRRRFLWKGQSDHERGVAVAHWSNVDVAEPTSPAAPR